MLNDLGRLPDISEGQIGPIRPDDLLDHLVRFLAAGLRAPME
ncbi:MAG: hypothetical protein VXW58_11495 [Pseudomonadota bacterium]|nr:hypothetical protein [Pseudomonadota bacterium]